MSSLDGIRLAPYYMGLRHNWGNVGVIIRYDFAQPLEENRRVGVFLA